MIISISLIVAAALFFAGWLFFSHTKKIVKPRYTEKLKANPLTDTEKMLANITMKKTDNEYVVENIETEETKKKTETTEVKKEQKNTENPDKSFDLKTAVLSSAILNKKVKKH